MSSNVSVPASEGCWRNECGSEGKRHVQEPAVNTYLLTSWLSDMRSLVPLVPEREHGARFTDS